MELKSDWLNDKYSRIEELSTDFSLSKYNFLKISFLKRLLEESAKNEDSCDTCKSNLKELEGMIEQIPLLEQIDFRQPYEKKFNLIRKHFHNDHGFIAPYALSTKWTLGGVVIGAIIAIVVSVFLSERVLLDPVLAGSAFGLIVGYLIGASKESVFRNSKKII